MLYLLRRYRIAPGCCRLDLLFVGWGKGYSAASPSSPCARQSALPLQPFVTPGLDGQKIMIVATGLLVSRRVSHCAAGKRHEGTRTEESAWASIGSASGWSARSGMRSVRVDRISFSNGTTIISRLGGFSGQCVSDRIRDASGERATTSDVRAMTHDKRCPPFILRIATLESGRSEGK